MQTMPSKLEVKACFTQWLRISYFYRSIEKLKVGQELCAKLILKGKRRMLI